MSTRVGFSGTRHGMPAAQYRALALALVKVGQVAELHHGDCLGADQQADALAHALQIDVIIHPPENPRLRAWCTGAAQYRPPLPYLVRNHAIVDETDVLLAAPKAPVDDAHSGTWATINYALKSGKPVIAVFRSGYCKWYEREITS